MTKTRIIKLIIACVVVLSVVVCAAIVIPAIVNANRVEGTVQDVEEIRLDTPRETVRTFFRTWFAYQQPGGFWRLEDLLKTCEAPPEDRKVAQNLVQDLAVVLTYFELNLGDIPSETQLERVVLEDAKREILIQGTGANQRPLYVELRKRDDTWVFSRESLNRVGEYADQIRQRGGDVEAGGYVNPRAAMRTFLGAVNRRDWQTARQGLNLDHVSPAARDEVGRSVALKIKYSIDRIGYVYDFEIPTKRALPYVYHRNEAGRIALARIEGGDRAGEWVFSVDTVDGAHDLFMYFLHAATAADLKDEAGIATLPQFSDAPGIHLRKFLPYWTQTPVGGLGIYQWVGLVVVVAFSWGIARVSLIVVELAIWGLLRRRSGKVTLSYVAEKTAPMRWFIVTWLVWVLITALDLPVGLLQWTLPILKFLTALAVVWAAYRIIDLIVEVFREEGSQNDINTLIIPSLAKSGKVIVVVGAIAYFIYVIGQGESLTQLLAGLGIGGLAVAFAAQDMLKNFFGSVVLMGDRPFRIGDWVVIDKTEGIIENVGFRSTRIRTFYQSLVTLPNSVVANAAIDNYGARKFRRYLTNVALAYDTPIDKLIAFREGIRELVRQDPQTRKDYFEIHVHTLADASINVIVYIFFRVPTWSAELQARERINLGILALAQSMQVEIAFPTQTLHLRQDAPRENWPPEPYDLPEQAGRDKALEVIESRPPML